MSKCDHCPFAEGRECNSYPALCANMTKAPEKWRPVLDRLNGIEPEYPPLLVQAANYVKSTVKHVAAGCPKPDQAEIDRRLAICATCEMFDPKQKRCTDCGCPAKAKAARAGEYCPLEKW